MITIVKRLFTSEEGLTQIEYALLAGLLALGLVMTLTTAGVTLDAFYVTLAEELKKAGGD